MKKKLIKMTALVVCLMLIAGMLTGCSSTDAKDGLSAYELAVQNGYEGSIQEWLESLNGKSAYEIAVENGYSGTEKDWSNSLSAIQGTASIKNAKINSKGELIITLSDDTSLNVGVVTGDDGNDGKNGVGISGVSVNDKNEFIVKFTDGKSVNLGEIPVINGKDGVSVTKSEINENGELVITYSNGQQANLGVVIGSNGKDGENGKDGKDGISIVESEINTAGELVVTYSDGTINNLGAIVGAPGKDGVNGTDGKDGLDGKDGIGVDSAEITSEGELVITYSNGQKSNLGNVIGAAGKDGSDGKDGVDGQDGQPGKDGIDGTDGKDGADGISVAKSEINSKGELVITYSDNRVENLGVVVGAAGKDGTDGKDGQDGTDGKDGVDGVNGKDGIGIEEIVINEADELVITLSNETTVNLGCIKGADGKDGLAGKDGINGQDGKDGADGKDGKDGISLTDAVINDADELVLTFSDNTQKNLGVVVGVPGKDGTNGKDGADGQPGKDGKDGLGIKNTEINDLGELVITYTDNTSDNLGVIVSDNGGAGTGSIAPRVRINDTTNEWEISSDGGRNWSSTGVKATGEAGKDGKDAVAPEVRINSADEWEISKDGGNSWESTGVKATGKDGEKGKDGAAGKDGEDGIGISGAKIDVNDHLVLTLSDNSTIDVGVVVGKDGADGEDGQNGKDGTGIKNVTVSADGVLTVSLDNGTDINLGNIRGKDGIGIAKSEINANGELVITYTDNKSVTVGKVVGKDGEDGVGIKKVELTADYMLKFTLDDGTTQSVGPVRGEKGETGVGIANVSVGSDGYLYITYDDGSEPVKVAYIKGEKGEQGEPGKDGQDGKDGADGNTPYIKNGNWWIGDVDTGIKASGSDGQQGQQGAAGKDGQDGKDGKDGVGIKNIFVDDRLHLMIELTSGQTIDAGYVGVEKEQDPEVPKTFTVTFKDWDGEVLKTQTVNEGEDATAPSNPSRDGYTFEGWDNVFTNVTSNIVVIAQYKEVPVVNDDPTITVSNVTASAGETVIVELFIENNPGINGTLLTLEYDESVMTLTKQRNGDAFEELSYQKPSRLESGCNFLWYGTDVEEVMDGLILTLTFEISETADAGTYEIKITTAEGDTTDANGTVSLKTNNGVLTVK